MTKLLITGPGDATATIVLAHGAGAPMDSPFMETMAARLADESFRLVRFEFPYMADRRVGRRRGPDRSSILVESWKSVIAEIRDSPPLVIGGKSMGGRIASMVADEAEVQGLVCLGYPFHPPGRPESLRTRHLATIRTPTLIVQGDRDPLGNREEVAEYDLSRSIRVLWLPDGDHSFKPRKKSGHTVEEHFATTVAAIADFIRRLD